MGVRAGRCRGWWAGAVLVLVVGSAACSDSTSGGGDGPVDVVAALDENDDLVTATEALFADDDDGWDEGTADERAVRVAERIASSVEAIETPLDPANVARYEEAVGNPVTDQVRHIGQVLGHTRAVADDAGDEALAYALRLGWTLAARLQPEPTAPVERLAWIVPDPAQFDDDTLSELADLLEDGDDAAASDLVRESEATVDAADVISAVEGELAELVPAEPGYDLVTTLHTSFGAAGQAPG